MNQRSHIEMAVATPASSEWPAIGIDLGTTFSCVAVVSDGRVEVIANEQGNYTTPSFVAFNQHERLIGDAAKQQIAANSVNTVFDVKRLIGRKFDDPVVQKEMQQWPFKIVNVNGMPKIEITYRNEVKRFSAEEISAMILGQMKEIAESYLNATVRNAVITVPAYFSDLQRKATKDAATIAGLNVSRIINEPTAAAFAYGLNKDTKTSQNILVYDLGGGTFDVSILKIHENIYEVKATGGDTHLGGEDFDNILMASLAAEFKLKHKVDISGNKKALRRLRTACERAKPTLSSAKNASIDIDLLAEGIDFVTNITRARFDDLCADLFRLTIKVVKSALKDAELTCEDVDKVVLVGGSTRIPKIQTLLRDLFEGKEINKSINVDEAVACGAAVQAAIIHGTASGKMEGMKLLEVTPLTLGVANSRHLMSPIIQRNTAIPVVRSKIYRTAIDNQDFMHFYILQGEYEYSDDNIEIGKIKVRGIPKAPAAVEKAKITFSIDANGIMNVTAVSKSDRQNKGEFTIENICGSLTKVQITRMIAEAELYRTQDQEMKKYHTARAEIEQFCYDVQVKHGKTSRVVNEKCNETLSWLKTCYCPKLSQFEQIKTDLTALISAPRNVKRKNDETSEVAFPIKIEKFEILECEDEGDDVLILPNEDDSVRVYEIDD